MTGLKGFGVATILMAGCNAVSDPPSVSCATQACAGDSAAVLFGGQTSAYSQLDDTWTWDGASWTQENVPGPSARSFAQAATLRGSMVLYGGFADGNLEDTWTWDGTRWSERAAGFYPIYNGGMATLNDSTVLYGGTDDWGLSDWETWTWNGASWVQENTLNGDSLLVPSVGAPLYVTNFGIAPLNDTVVLFGGTNYSDAASDETWLWNGTTWTELEVPGPSARNFTAMATLGGTVILFGGCNFTCDTVFGDTWIWDGASWTQLNVAGPSARFGHTMATVRDTVVLFGGQDASGNLTSDTWVWNGATWSQANVDGPPARSGAVMATLSSDRDTASAEPLQAPEP
jgi:Galactose oxidase, central domain